MQGARQYNLYNVVHIRVPGVMLVEDGSPVLHVALRESFQVHLLMLGSLMVVFHHLQPLYPGSLFNTLKHSLLFFMPLQRTEKIGCFQQVVGL